MDKLVQPAPSVTSTVEDMPAIAERILQSKTFARSPRLREFLTFVVTCVAQNRTHEVNEYSLGVQVFGKGPDFNPNLDNIVRVTARQLRQKLADYYANEGVNDPLHLCIPKGCYVPMLEPKTAAESPANEPLLQPPAGRRAWLIWALVAIAVSGWAAAFALASRSQVPSAYLLTSLMSGGPRSISVVLDDPFLPKAWEMVGQRMTFDDYMKGRYLSSEYYKNGEANYFRKLLTDSYYIQFTTVQLLEQIAALAHSRGIETAPIASRMLAASKMESGNLVFIGGVGSNPWVGEIQKHLAF